MGVVSKIPIYTGILHFVPFFQVEAQILMHDGAEQVSFGRASLHHGNRVM